MATNTNQAPATEVAFIPEGAEDNVFVKAANIEGNRVVVQVNTTSGQMDVVRFDDLLEDLRDLANSEELDTVDRATLGMVFRLLRSMK